MTCSVEESVAAFKEAFYKKVVGNAKNISLSNNDTLITISPKPGVKIDTTDKAYKVAESKVKAIQELSKKFLGSTKAFKIQQIQTSPDGEVSFVIRPPFEIYREVLAKKEEITEKKAVLARAQQERVNKLDSQITQALDENATPEQASESLELVLKRQEEINLFNYEERNLDNQMGALFNIDTDPELDPNLNADEEVFMNLDGKSFKDTLEEGDEELIDIDLENKEVDKKSQAELQKNLIKENYITEAQAISSRLDFLEAAKKYKLNLIDKLKAAKKKIVQTKVDKNNKEQFDLYKSNLNQVDNLIAQSYKDLSIYNQGQQDHIIQVLSEEIVSLVDIMTKTDPDSLFETFFANDVYTRVKFLEKMIPDSLRRESRNQAENTVETDLGNYKGAFNLDFASTETRMLLASQAKQMSNALEKLITLTPPNSDGTPSGPSLITSMMENDAIFKSNIQAGKYTEEQLLDYAMNQVIADTNLWHSKFTGISDNDEVVEHHMARSALAVNTAVERGLNYNYSKKFTESFKALEAMFSSVSKAEARKKINNLLMDRSQHGRTLISKFTKEYHDAKKNFNELTRAVASSAGPEKGFNFKAKILALDATHDVIKPHMIRALKTAFPSKIDLFTESEADMEAYEKDLQKRLGKDYERQITEMTEKLMRYEIFEENQAMLNPLTAGKRIAEESPWEFARDLDYFIEIAKQGGTEELMTPYDKPDGTTGYTYNNAMGKLTLIPKGDPTSNPTHYSEQFNEVEASPEAYEAWKDTHDYYTNFINPRLGTPPTYLSKIRGDFFENISQAYRDKNLWEATKQAFKGILDNIRAIAEEQGVHYSQLKTVKSDFNDSAEREIELESKILKVKKISDLEILIQENSIDFNLTEESIYDRIKELPENITNSENTNRSIAKIELKNAMIEALAREYVYSRYSSDFLRTTLALGQLAYVQKAQEETLKVTTLLETSSNLRYGGERKRSTEKFKKWQENAVKNNIKGFSKTVQARSNEKGSDGKAVKSEDTLGALKEANNKASNIANSEWFNTEYNMGSRTGRFANKFKRNIGRNYGETEGKFLDFMADIFENKNFSEDFEFIVPVIDELGEEQRATYRSKGSGEFSLTYKTIDEGGQVETIEKDISEQEYLESLGGYYSSMLNELGTGRSLAGVGKTAMGGFSYSMLGFKVISGMMNRFEGKSSLRVEDIRRGTNPVTGINAETTGLMADSFLSGYNFLKISHAFSKDATKGKRASYATLDQLCDVLDIFQSRTSIIDRLDPNKTLTSKFKEVLNPFNAAVDFPERKNQYGILLRNLAETMVKDKAGNEHPIFGDINQFESDTSSKPLYGPDGSIKTKGTGFNIYIPGTLTLKEQFRTPENIKQWENFEVDFGSSTSANQALSLGLRTTLNINNIAGNFSQQDAQPILDTGLGMMISMFNRWFGARLSRNFMDRKHLNPLTGEGPKSAYISRKRISNSPAVALGTGAMMTMMAAGSLGAIPIGILISGIAAGGVMLFARKLNGDSKALRSRQAMLGLATEVFARTLELPSTLYGNSRGLSITKKDGYNKYSPLQRGVLKGTVSKEEAEGLRILSHQLATNIWAMAMPVLTASLYPWMAEMIDVMTGYEDDDDEKLKEEKRAREAQYMALLNSYNYTVNNLGNRMIDMNTSEYQPVKWITDLTKLVLLENLSKASKNVAKFEEDPDTETGWGAANSALTMLGINPVTGGMQNMAKYIFTKGEKGTLAFADSKVYDNSRFNQDLIRKFKPSEDRIKYLLNSTGEGFKEKIYKALIDQAIESEGIDRTNKPKTEAFIDGIKRSPDFKFIKKKTREDYIDNLERITKEMENSDFFKRLHPELILKAQRELKAYKKIRAKEDAHFETLPENIQAKGNYRYDDGKLKASKENIKTATQHIIDAGEAAPEVDESIFEENNSQNEEE